MKKEEIIKKISKPSTLFRVGGLRAIDSIQASWFGKILLCKKGEDWPSIDGNLMTPLCQINLSNIPYKPDIIKDINFICVFIDKERIFNEEGSDSVLIRTYENLDDLIPLRQLEYKTSIKPFQLDPYLEENDCPCWDDCPINIPEDFEDKYEMLFENKSGIKIGGWPTLIQSEIFWTPFNKNAEDISFVFQIDSIEKANWSWGNSGVGYFGKNTQTNDWSFTWQAY
ncbi:DUF1963 domain-containing protein [Algibacter sp. 2305UL17-15]|uniref:DUF1963 domain-containing protein n=1 Tax=Algibacter sp. 2305UL17-15 TaxID=3231268 RepID=UPI003457DDDE